MFAIRTFGTPATVAPFSRMVPAVADEFPIVIPPRLSLNWIAPRVSRPLAAAKSIATPFEDPCGKLLNRATSVAAPSVGSPAVVTPGTFPAVPSVQLTVSNQFVFPLPCQV